MILELAGAKVYGISLKTNNKKIYYSLIKNNFFCDINDFSKLNRLVQKIKPHIIFHLAAQSIVLSGFKKIVEDLIECFLSAGDLAIQLREKGLIKKIKSDNTPVSNGDLEVNNLLSKVISKITPEIPIISEESLENKDKLNLKNFWLIDPIDGTYDYINNLEEFTINAGLIIDNKPVAGLINAPAKKRMFYSYGEGNAYELFNGKTSNLSNSITKNNRNN